MFAGGSQNSKFDSRMTLFLKMVNLNSNKILLSLISLLLFNGYSDALFMWNSLRKTSESVVIDRSLESNSISYYIPSIDRTAFSASREMYLKQIDIPKIYIQNSDEEILLQNMETEVEIVELNGEEKIVFSGRAALDSTYETNIIFSTGILLKSNTNYEIRVKMPNQQNYIYHDKFGISEHQIILSGQSITVNFYQHNTEHIPIVAESRFQMSHGVIKRLHFKNKQY